jgi:glycosyltransferase involved in cell wall biosynthesis
MKILHAVLSHGFYGSERYCIELAIAQARRGHDVMVLAQDRNSQCVRRFEKEIAGESNGSVRLSVIPRFLPAFLHRPFARWQLARFKPDIVHSHLNAATRRVGTPARRLGIPHIATLHIRFEPREHGHCDGLVCDADWQTSLIPASFRGEVTVVWPWLPDSVRRALARVQPSDTDVLRKSWSADAKTIVFGSAGRLVPEKGMDLLVQAFRLAFAKGDEPVRLIVVGGGSEKDALQELSDNDRRIVFAGAQDAIENFYPAFDIYVSAARFEPFGLTIIEAMDAGCRLVVTRSEGPRAFLRDDRVLWSEPNDHIALAESLRFAAGLGRKRLTYDLAPFSREHAAEAVEAFYQRVIQQGHRWGEALGGSVAK